MRRVVLAVALTVGGCAGLKSVQLVTGACADELDRCVAEQCEMVVDDRACRTVCEYEGRQCERRQGTGGSQRPRLGDDQALIVDLFGPKVHHSAAIALEQGGQLTPIEGAHALAPGAFLKMAVTFPPDTREAELAITHAPGGPGDACFVTLTVGEKTLLGRYTPPRTGRLRLEVFPLTEALGPPDPERPKTVMVTLYNNAAAGSSEPYHLASLQFFYRAMTTPAPR